MQSASLIKQLAHSNGLLQELDVVVESESLLGIVVKVAIVWVDKPHHDEGVDCNIELEACGQVVE